MGLWVFMRNTIFYPFSSYLQYIVSTCLTTVDTDLDHLAEIVFVKFLHCKVTPPPPFPYSVLWKEITLYSPHIRRRELRSTFLRVEYLHKSF